MKLNPDVEPIKESNTFRPMTTQTGAELPQRPTPQREGREELRVSSKKSEEKRIEETSPEEQVSGPGKFNSEAAEAVLREKLAPPPPFDTASFRAAVVGSGKGERVGAHHKTRFMSTRGVLEPILQENEKQASGFGVLVGECLRAKRRLLTRTDQFLTNHEPGPPWTGFDLVQTGIYGVVATGVLFVGWQALSGILMTSGFEAFEDPVRAQTFSLVPIAASFMWETFGSTFSSDASKRQYEKFVYLSAMALAAFWIVLFVHTFGDGLAAGSGIGLGGLLGESGEKEESGGSTYILLTVGVLAETMIAASCWLAISKLITKHRFSKPVTNPSYAALEREVSVYFVQEVAALDLAARLRARLREIELGCEVYVQQAEDIFELAEATKSTDLAKAEAAKLGLTSVMKTLESGTPDGGANNDDQQNFSFGSEPGDDLSNASNGGGNHVPRWHTRPDG